MFCKKERICGKCVKTIAKANELFVNVYKNPVHMSILINWAVHVGVCFLFEDSCSFLDSAQIPENQQSSHVNKSSYLHMLILSLWTVFLSEKTYTKWFGNLLERMKQFRAVERRRRRHTLPWKSVFWECVCLTDWQLASGIACWKSGGDRVAYPVPKVVE